MEEVLTVREIAAEWKLSVDTVQRLFLNEPDVCVIQTANAGKRPKKTLRIPAPVKDRVWRRLCNAPRRTK